MGVILRFMSWFISAETLAHKVKNVAFYTCCPDFLGTPVVMLPPLQRAFKPTMHRYRAVEYFGLLLFPLKGSTHPYHPGVSGGFNTLNIENLAPEIANSKTPSTLHSCSAPMLADSTMLSLYYSISKGISTMLEMDALQLEMKCDKVTLWIVCIQASMSIKKLQILAPCHAQSLSHASLRRFPVWSPVGGVWYSWTGTVAILELMVWHEEGNWTLSLFRVSNEELSRSAGLLTEATFCERPFLSLIFQQLGLKWMYKSILPVLLLSSNG